MSLFNRLLKRKTSRARSSSPADFAHILNWKILRGSHEFPGPDGGTCVNEAATVAAGYPYRAVRRIDDCPASFSRPLALYAMCLNEIILSDGLRQDILMPFVTRLAGSADTLEVEMQRVALIFRRTVAEIVPEALEPAGYAAEAARCRAVGSIDDALAVAKELSGRNWHRQGTHLIGLVNAITMASEDYLAYRAVDAVQYAGTSIADVAEVINSVNRGPVTAEDVYRRGGSILDAALMIGNQAQLLAEDLVGLRMEKAKRTGRAQRATA